MYRKVPAQISEIQRVISDDTFFIRRDDKHGHRMLSRTRGVSDDCFRVANCIFFGIDFDLQIRQPREDAGADISLVLAYARREDKRIGLRQSGPVFSM